MERTDSNFRTKLDEICRCF